VLYSPRVMDTQMDTFSRWDAVLPQGWPDPHTEYRDQVLVRVDGGIGSRSTCLPWAEDPDSLQPIWRIDSCVSDFPGGKKMKNSRTFIPALVFACALLLPVTAMANGLESFLDEIEIRASKDIGSFRADLRLTFDASNGTLDGLFEVMSKPSDVYMCLRVGEVTKQPIDRVVEEYHNHKGQGWGVIAKNLGVKPGSEEFHALKAGRISSSSGGGSSVDRNKGKHKK
jgi:hypothetical protein